MEHPSNIILRTTAKAVHYQIIRNTAKTAQKSSEIIEIYPLFAKIKHYAIIIQHGRDGTPKKNLVYFVF